MQVRVEEHVALARHAEHQRQETREANRENQDERVEPALPEELRPSPPALNKRRTTSMLILLALLSLLISLLVELTSCVGRRWLRGEGAPGSVHAMFAFCVLDVLHASPGVPRPAAARGVVKP